MNSRTKMVTVYDFKELTDQGAERLHQSRFKATRDAIRRLGGEIIEGTEREVPHDQLDELGRFRRYATGWGELA